MMQVTCRNTAVRRLLDFIVTIVHHRRYLVWSAGVLVVLAVLYTVFWSPGLLSCLGGGCFASDSRAGKSKVLPCHVPSFPKAENMGTKAENTGKTGKKWDKM
jgi:hypothetical protein